MRQLAWGCPASTAFAVSSSDERASQDELFVTMRPYNQPVHINLSFTISHVKPSDHPSRQDQKSLEAIGTFFTLMHLIG